MKNWKQKVRKYFEEAGLADKIDYRIGDAATIIPSLERDI